ncbi:NUDIX domain-containing protein [Agreia sp. COWG]|uniref:NUDIX domain-containing protein n=1 Tax=Agreia sp. COWG TaxID=2773266 RepID=UPI001F177799|nr:NUDIX domain-containing protein [Agreia sp. COWG]
MTAPDGRTFWGTFGAAGLLVHDDRGVLLQHRVAWSHFGGTWGLPGGARHEGESAVEGALRESEEEAGVPASSLRLEFATILDLGVWSYTTIVARAADRFEAVIGDAESTELRWIPLSEVDTLPLHPGFAARWNFLRALIEQPVTVLVDTANVLGSRPTGWWRDRVGATSSLLRSISELSERGFRGSALDLDVDAVWPRVVAVTEGQAAAARTNGSAVDVVAASGSGDDAIVTAAIEATRAGSSVVVVTADAQLRERVVAVGARVLGPSWLWQQIDGNAPLG